MIDWRSGLDGFGLCCENALCAYRHSLIEEICAGAVVGYLPGPSCRDGGATIPIAAAPASLAEEVARELLANPYHCAFCHNHGPCVSHPKPPPFAAAYTDGPDGRKYTLASCLGGANVGKIAQRYGGSGDERLASFVVR